MSSSSDLQAWPERQIVEGAIGPLPALAIERFYEHHEPSLDVLGPVRAAAERIVHLNGPDVYQRLRAVRTLDDSDEIYTLLVDAAFLLGVEYGRTQQGARV